MVYGLFNAAGSFTFSVVIIGIRPLVLSRFLQNNSCKILLSSCRLFARSARCTFIISSKVGVL